MPHQRFFLLPLIVTLISCQSARVENRQPSSAITISIFEIPHSGRPELAQSFFIGAELGVEVKGLSPNGTYQLVAESNIAGKQYRNSLNVVADKAGVIRSFSDGEKTATMTGNPDDLFWKMKDVGPNADLQRRLVVQIKQDASVVASTPLDFVTKRPGVRTEDVNNGNLVGKLFFPAGAVPPHRPVIISFPGSEGGLKTSEDESAYFANAGYPAFGMAYFNAPGVPEEMVEVPLEIFERAFAFIRSKPELRDRPIVVNGVSRGGELALLLGSLFAEVKGVIARVPSSIVWQGFTKETFVSDKPERELPPFTFRKHPIPYMNWTGKYADHKMRDGTAAKIRTPWFLDSINRNQDGVKRASIEVEKINGPVLLLGAEDDQLWPSCIFIDRIKERFAQHSFRHSVMSACAPNAGHTAVRLPLHFPTTVEITVHPITKANLFMGGTPEGNALAQRTFRTKILDFLERSFRAQAPTP